MLIFYAIYIQSSVIKLICTRIDIQYTRDITHHIEKRT